MPLFVCTGNSGKIQEYRDSLGHRTRLVGLRDVEPVVGQAFPEPEENYDSFLGNALLKLFSCLTFVAQGAPERVVSLVDEILVDDSGLCVPALGLEPGVHSAYYGGLPRDPVKNRSVLRQAIATHPEARNERLDAFFVCFLLTLKVAPEHLEWARNTPGLERAFSLARAQSAEAAFMNEAVDTVRNTAGCGGRSSMTLALADLFSELPAPLARSVAELHFGYCVGEVATEEQSLIPGAGHGYDCMFYARQHPELSFASIALEQKNRESHRALAMMGLMESRG